MDYIRYIINLSPQNVEHMTLHSELIAAKENRVSPTNYVLMHIRECKRLREENRRLTMMLEYVMGRQSLSAAPSPLAVNDVSESIIQPPHVPSPSVPAETPHTANQTSMTDSVVSEEDFPNPNHLDSQDAPVSADAFDIDDDFPEDENENGYDGGAGLGLKLMEQFFD